MINIYIYFPNFLPGLYLAGKKNHVNKLRNNVYLKISTKIEVGQLK